MTLLDPPLEKRLIMGKTADVMNVLFRFNHNVFTDSFSCRSLRRRGIETLTPRAGESSVLGDSLRKRVLLSHRQHLTPLQLPLHQRLVAQHSHLRQTVTPPNVISLKRLNCLQNIQEMLKTISDQTSLRRQRHAAKTRFESAAVNEVLPPNSIYSVLIFLHLELHQPPDGRHYPTASDERFGG
ncbi:hypothetical protein BLNAU_8262 [Blattamonas nauphoetae]|uniref:Uncharacterized protein n=1 Tax=Blattamonas nauphoetae TaxID=2049346 RepID=A0ABQ9XZD0_9EUKA|nr:hypothetical protein BLNAU_8262 [Blattamonas nauphoetae]